MAKRIVRDALFAAIALALFVVEAQIPLPVPIPWIKLGLANIVTVWMIMKVGVPDALGVLLVRIALGGIFTGRLPSLVFSLAGGLLAFCAVLLLRKILKDGQIFVAGVVGAVFHNVGQLAAATAFYSAPSVLIYSPILILSGIVTGLFTGLLAQMLAKRLPRPKG